MTVEQAKNFILKKQGLIGKRRFAGKEGVMSFVRQAGCVQFDPIDVCGKNVELTLQSRVEDFSKDTLYELLYTDRALVDYFDKNLSVFPAEDWPYFARVRQEFWRKLPSGREVSLAEERVLAEIADRGPLCSEDLPFDQKVDWWWSPTTLSRAVLESLYFRGRLVIHHKKGTKKYYDLSERHLAADLLNAPDPNPAQEEFDDFMALRRIGSVGLLWNRPSDAWLGMGGFTAARRNAAFSRLTAAGKIAEVAVEGIRNVLYYRTEDEALWERGDLMPRTELLAPLDNLLWDRKLIFALFGFDYKWEIYTPVHLRKYGYYVLPLLQGNRLIGRAEAVKNQEAGSLDVLNVWYENRTNLAHQPETESCFLRFAAFHGLDKVRYLGK